MEKNQVRILTMEDAKIVNIDSFCDEAGDACENIKNADMFAKGYNFALKRPVNPEPYNISKSKADKKPLKNILCAYFQKRIFR